MIICLLRLYLSQQSPTFKTNLFDTTIRLQKFSLEVLVGLIFFHKIDGGQKVRAGIVTNVLEQDVADHSRIKNCLLMMTMQK